MHVLGTLRQFYLLKAIFYLYYFNISIFFINFSSFQIDLVEN